MSTPTEFDKELARIINHAIVRDSKDENLLETDKEAIKRIKLAVDKYVIEGNHYPASDDLGDAAYKGIDRKTEMQRQSLWGASTRPDVDLDDMAIPESTGGD